jgi:predicted O-methyltransferase YrrM
MRKPVSKDWMQRTAHTRVELRHHPVVRGAATALAVSAAGRGVHRTRTGMLTGLAAGLVQGCLLERLAALERDVRNTEDAALLAPIVALSDVSLGTWAAEPDFLRLVVAELSRDPVGVLELGSGASTVLMAAVRRRRGGPPVISIDHDPAYAQRTWATLARAGLQDEVELHVAPLRPSVVCGRQLVWYDRDVLERAAPAQIDLLVIDGPPSTTRLARWPAVELLNARLGDGSVVLLDDGRRRDETATARRWARDHPDLALFWHDTVKGTWRLEPRSRADGQALQLARRGIRALDAHPAGFRRWSVRR